MLIRRISLILAALYFTSHLFLAGCATTDDEELAEDDDTEEVSEEDSEENDEQSAENNEENGNQNSDENNEFAENNEGQEDDDEDQEDSLAEDNFDNSSEGEEIAEATNQDLQQMINEAEASNSSNEAPIEPLAENTASNNAPMNEAPMNEAPMNEAPSNVGSSTASTGFSLPEMGSKMPYIIQAGDTLESVAGRIYGNPSKWMEIQELSSIQNPNSVHPGDVVYYQLTNESMAFASNYEGLARSEVVVKAGDTLSGLAQELTGSYENWKSIWRQNDSIENPDQISVGQRIYYVNSSLLNATINFVKNVKVANILNIDTNKNVKSLDSDSQKNTQKSVKSQPKTFSQLSVQNILSDFGFSMSSAS